MGRYVLGVESGGTKYLIKACDLQGRVLASYIGPSAYHYRVGNDTAAQRIAANVSACLEAFGGRPEDCLAITTIAEEDGTPLAIETNNWWAVTMFNPDIDPEVHARLLAMMDWICTEEGQLTVLVGVPGETWEYDAEGNIVMLTKPDENGNYPNTVDLYNSYNVFRTQGILADDYSFINPANDPSVVAQVKEMYATRQSGKIIPLDQDYEFFSSDSKANYSLDLSDEVTKLIISKDTDIEAEWKNYIEANKGIWQPVIDDLNAALIK